MSVSTTPAPAIALLLVTSFEPIRGMRVAYGIVVILFLIAAATRLKLKETVRNVEKPNLKEALISYPEALQEGIKSLEKRLFIHVLSFLRIGYIQILFHSDRTVYSHLCFLCNADWRRSGSKLAFKC